MSVSGLFVNVLRSPNPLLAWVCEIYDPATEPGADGFDPADALECFAKISGITFATRDYRCQVSSFGNIDRSMGPSFNNVSIEFDNTDRFVTSFILAQPLGIEGFHLIIRLISPGVSTVVDDSYPIFVGRCQKAGDISKPSCTISALQHLGTVDQNFPRRTFGVNDLAGRASTNPEFEGFIFVPQQISVSFQTKQRRGGILGFFGFKKTVTQTLAYSSKSDLDANTYVPEVLGRSQLQAKVIAEVDTGLNIYAILGWSEGPIFGYTNDRILTSGFKWIGSPIQRFGEIGGTSISGREQQPATGPNWPGNGYYSLTAWTAEAFSGSAIDTEDDAPDRASTIIGRIIPTPNEFGVFPDTNGDDADFKWSDNPAYLIRWLLTVKHGFNLPASFIDDDVCIQTALFCNQAVRDLGNENLAVIPSGIPTGTGGVIRFQPTGTLGPAYFRGEFLGDPSLHTALVEAPYIPWNPGDGTLPDLTPVPGLRRRYTCNVPITDQLKVIDLLYNILCAGSRLYLVQGTNGKIQIRVKKPVDNSLIRDDTAAGATEIPVNSVYAWIGDLSGKALIGHTLSTSELREITGTRFSITGNDITLTVSGALTASGATLSGGDGASTPATASVTVTDATGGTITIDSIAVPYVGIVDDVTGSVAAMLASAVNADTTLNLYVRADWDPTSPDVVSLTAKLGFLQFADATVNAHTSLEEVIRVRMGFSDRAEDINAGTHSPILKGSFQWPMVGKQSSINQVTGTYRDSANDYASTKLIVKDSTHIAQTNKTSNQDFDLSSCDSNDQSSRVLNSELAELRDGDFFTQSGVDGEGLLLNEGDVVCTSESSGGFTNLAVRIESLSISPDNKATLVGRRYLTSMYIDNAVEKVVPLPTSLRFNDGPPIPINVRLVFDGTRAWVTWKGVGGLTYQLASDTSGLETSFLFDGPGGAANFLVMAGMTNVYLRSARNGDFSVWVIIPITGAGTGVPGRPAPYGVSGTATDSTHAAFTWTRNATDNDDVEYSIDGGSTWTATGDPTSVSVTITASAGTTVTLTVRNKWSSGTTYSDVSSGSVVLPSTGASANDPIDLRVVRIFRISAEEYRIAYTWNPQSGTDPTLHFNNITESIATDFNPTTTPTTQVVPALSPGDMVEAYVSNSDGANNSNTRETTVPSE